jgi:hypothetical protein
MEQHHAAIRDDLSNLSATDPTQICPLQYFLKVPEKENGRTTHLYVFLPFREN